jgi:hypothetical protein
VPASDLVRACVFCAGLLFGTEAPVWPGVSADVGVAYATLARSVERPEVGGHDLSDITPKFLSIGAGGARLASGTLGAGTPVSEWRLRVALGPSHDEQEMTPFSTSNVTATGTGRYENFALTLRQALSDRDSIEVGGERRTHKGTDLVNLGGERFVLGEERTLSAERIDIGLGWRHRFEGVEAAVSGRWVKPSGSVGTAGTFRIAGSGIWGGGLELKGRRGAWTGWASGEYASGSIDVHEENFPDFVARDSQAPARLEAYRLGVLWAPLPGDKHFEASLSGTFDRSRLPFLALALLGSETTDLERGYHPDSTAREYAAEVAVRYRLSRAIRIGAFLRLGYGDETVVLTDATGVLPSKRVEVDRSGVFGNGLSKALGQPAVTIGLNADFKLDTGK